MVQLELSEEIPSEVIRTALHETIENKLKSKNYQIIVSSASKVGDTNFIGIIYRVAFKKENDENYDKFILKVAPQNAARRIQFHSRPLFLREVRMYNEVLPFFRQFEQSKNISHEDSFTEYPKCYRTIDEEPNECIFLEDLSIRNLAIIDLHTKEVTVDHARLVMQTLGKFHALSFAVKDQQPEKFKELAFDLAEMVLLPHNASIKEFLNKQSKNIISLLTDEKDAHVMIKIQNLFKKDAINIIGECLDLEAAGSASVITHGDVWQNNIMFRCDKSGKPIEICFLDWQVCRNTSPIIDIVYFMFCCTTKELRDMHYENLLRTYYESLAAQTTRLGSALEKLFPYGLMEEHLRKFGKYGLILAMLLLPVITADGNGELDLDKMSEDILSGKQIDGDAFISEKSRIKLNKRLRDVAVDMVRLEYV